MNRKLDACIEVLDRLKGGELTWTDLTGTHTGTWEQFKGAVLFRLIGRLEPLNDEDCPLVSVDMGQFNDLDDIIKCSICVLLRWIGFLDNDYYDFLMENLHWR